jgi:hypothetical protein
VPKPRRSQEERSQPPRAALIEAARRLFEEIASAIEVARDPASGMAAGLAIRRLRRKSHLLIACFRQCGYVQ